MVSNSISQKSCQAQTNFFIVNFQLAGLDFGSIYGGEPLPVEKVGLESCPDETNGRREKGHADEDAETTSHEGKGAFPGVTMISAQEGRKSNNRKSEPQNKETYAGRKALN